MKKLASVIAEIDAVLTKNAFIPAPQQGQGGEQGGQDPQMQQLLSQLPPEVAEQVSQLPPDQQQAALQQIMSQLGGQGGQGQPPQGDPSQQDPTKAPDGNPIGKEGRKDQPEQIQGGTPPTDLQNSTITLRVADLLDLVSGGNATKSQLAVQQHILTAQQKQKQMQQKEVENQKKREMQQQAQQAQMQSGPGGAMAQAGGMMGGQGGIY